MQAAQLRRTMQYRKMIDILMGEGYADLVLQGGSVINVVTREIYPADVAIQGEYILMVGDCSGLIGPKTQRMDVSGKFLSPGFIDSHMHFESAMLTLSEFSRLSIPSGTTTLIADPHEIANVAGVAGIQAMLEEAKLLPNRIRLTIPCLTPDVPGLETAGADLNAQSIEPLLGDAYVQGLGEMQGFSNVKPVFEFTPHLIDDLLASSMTSVGAGKTVEGNAPDLFGAELAAHLLVCGGHTSCHETTTKAECVEKLRAGVTVFMREGSTQKNMAECIRAVTEDGLESRRLVLATDDMVAEDLIKEGHMNEIVRRTIARGVDPVEAIQMVTINAAEHFRLFDIGILAPGKAADIAVIGDLTDMRVDAVVMGGKLAAQGGELLLEIAEYTYPQAVKATVKREKVKSSQLAIPSRQSSQRVRGIVVIPDQNLTEGFSAQLNVHEGCIQPAPEQDVLPLFVAERHGRHGGIGKTFIKGMGLKRGAIALSVAHDTHNIIACGANYDDIAMAINRVIAMQGGIALIEQGKLVGDLPLPVAGLMTDAMGAKEVCDRINLLHTLAKDRLGCTIHAPFMHLSFLALVTSPKYKITDKGLIDTENYRIIDTVE